MKVTDHRWSPPPGAVHYPLDPAQVAAAAKDGYEPYNDRGITGVIVDIADLDNFEAKFNLEPIK